MSRSGDYSRFGVVDCMAVYIRPQLLQRVVACCSTRSRRRLPTPSGMTHLILSLMLLQYDGATTFTHALHVIFTLASLLQCRSQHLLTSPSHLVPLHNLSQRIHILHRFE